MAAFDTWDKHTNKRLAKLHPEVRQAACDLINQVEQKLDIRLRVTQALRTFEEQDELFEQGRSKSGKIVTNARGGQSYHNYGLAIDVVEIRNGQAIWDCDWLRIAELAEPAGWEWGGRWASFPDKPHFQRSFGKSTAELAALRDGAVDADGYVTLT